MSFLPLVLRRLLLASLLVSGAAAQDPSVAPTRLEEGESIDIDGRLEEPLWQRAAVAGPFTEAEPVQGRLSDVETICRIAYDADFLYIALDCQERPGLVRDRLMVRDANLDPDDRVELWIDPFNAGRFAYWFQIGAGGSRGDALISDGGSRFNKRWDGIWYGRSTATDRGWKAEIAIPFKTIGFEEGLTTWGFNIRRIRKALERDLRWASPLAAYRFFNVATGGKLEGLAGMRQGVGLDVVPYGKVNASRDRTVDPDTSTVGDFGVDLSYRITPSLGLLLTYNTDFAETEVDDRQINLTRFPLFFPEKRDFFLQDSDLFQFGRGGSDVIPFFSRRVGRDSSGNVVPILGGMKLTGREAGWNVGTLGTVLDENPPDEEKALGVVRVSRDVGEESSVGVIATGGRPEGPGDASTMGADFRVRSSRFGGEGRTATLWGYWVTTQNGGVDNDDDAWSLQAQYRTMNWEHEIGFLSVGPDFSPELGFVRRSDFRRLSASTEYTWRVNDEVIRRVDFAFRPRYTTLADNTLDGWDLPITWAEIEFGSLDGIELSSRRRFERVPEPFEIRDGITVSAGDYHETRHELEIDTADQRVVAGRFELEVGDIYSGNLTRWSIGPSWIPNQFVRLEGAYEEFRVHLNEGNFTTRVTEGRLDFDFNPEVSFRNLIQYDTESKDMTVQSRLRWIIEPGSDLFLVGVWGWNKDVHSAPLVPTTQDVTLKVSYTLRF